MNNLSIEFRIIIPFFNADKFIGKCIDSIKSQTYQKFSVYIFDDCSSDNSFEVAKSFIKDDDRFFLKRKRFTLMRSFFWSDGDQKTTSRIQCHTHTHATLIAYSVFFDVEVGV